jgi:hypothetical protein
MRDSFCSLLCRKLAFGHQHIVDSSFHQDVLLSISLFSVKSGFESFNHKKVVSLPLVLVSTARETNLTRQHTIG